MLLKKISTGEESTSMQFRIELSVLDAYILNCAAAGCLFYSHPNWWQKWQFLDNSLEQVFQNLCVLNWSSKLRYPAILWLVVRVEFEISSLFPVGLALLSCHKLLHRAAWKMVRW